MRTSPSPIAPCFDWRRSEATITYNTTIYSLDDRYRGVFGGRMVVFMNEDDMKARDS